MDFTRKTYRAVLRRIDSQFWSVYRARHARDRLRLMVDLDDLYRTVQRRGRKEGKLR